MRVAAHGKKAGNEAGPEVVQSSPTKTKSEDPGAPGSASGAELEAANFTKTPYPIVAARVHHLCSRLPITPDQAALLAGIVFGEVRG